MNRLEISLRGIIEYITGIFALFIILIGLIVFYGYFAGKITDLVSIMIGASFIIMGVPSLFFAFRIISWEDVEGNVFKSIALIIAILWTWLMSILFIYAYLS